MHIEEIQADLTYLRKKLRESYLQNDYQKTQVAKSQTQYRNLLTKYQQQLVKCAEIQHLNDYYEGERNYHLGKRKGEGGQYIV